MVVSFFTDDLFYRNCFNNNYVSGAGCFLETVSVDSDRFDSVEGSSI